MKEKQVTEELGGILSYMTDVLFIVPPKTV